MLGMRNFWNELMEQVGITYTPERWVTDKLLDKPTRHRQPTTDNDIPTNANYNVRLNKWIVADTDIPTEEQPTNGAWKIIPTPTRTDKLAADRQPTLTAWDTEILNDRELEHTKAQTIKPYWFNGVVRKEAAKIIGKKGYSESVIGIYYAVFSTAYEEQTTPPEIE